MQTLKMAWAEYSDTVAQYKDIRYHSLQPIRILPKKELCGGGVCVRDHIFGIPNSSRQVLELMPDKNTVKFFGRTRTGTFKWTGSCLFQGIIYGFPRKENSILAINPETERVSVIELDLHYRGEHHYGGVVTPDGTLYQPPRNTDHILRIDLSSFSVSTIPLSLDGERLRYSASVQVPSGEIYLIPEYGFRTAVLFPESGKVEFIGDPFTHLVFGVVVGWDGNIYGFSKEGYGILRVDVAKKTVDWVCQEIGNPDCYGSVVGINGRIYGIPAGGRTIWEFDVTRQTAEALFDVPDGIAKCAGAAVRSDGTIGMIPCFGEYLYLLSTDGRGSVNLENRFFNTYY